MSRDRRLPSRRPDLASATLAVEQHGALLVYPVANRPDPRSLWSVFFPRTPMRWDWDETGDDRVVSLWRLREELARSHEVVYTKWLAGRATFFARDLFVAMLATYRATGALRRGLEPDARDVLAALESDSPQGTKRLRASAGLTGRVFQSAYARATRELFERLLIVGYGEVDEGAFPSLALAATRTLFEDLWEAAGELDPGAAERTIAARLPGGAFTRQHRRVLARLRALA